MEHCPKCRSNRIHRAPLNGVLEHVRRRTTRKRPYKCSTCGWRGWAYVPHWHRHAAVTSQPTGPEPDLQAIDKELNAK